MEYKEVIKQIVILAFEKARKESLQILKTPLSKHISFKIEHDFKIYISEKTFVRYYDKFIVGKENAAGKPNRRILDFLCKYIGYDNFIDFYNKKEKNKKKNKKKEKTDSLNFSSLLHKKKMNGKNFLSCFNYIKTFSQKKYPKSTLSDNLNKYLFVLLKLNLSKMFLSLD